MKGGLEKKLREKERYICYCFQWRSSSELEETGSGSTLESNKMLEVEVLKGHTPFVVSDSNLAHLLSGRDSRWGAITAENKVYAEIS